MRKIIPQPWIKKIAEKSLWKRILIWLGIIHIIPVAMLLLSLIIGFNKLESSVMIYIGYLWDGIFFMLYAIGHLLVEGRPPWRKSL